MIGKYNKKIAAFVIAISILFAPFNVPVVEAAVPTDFVSCWDLEESSGTRVDENTSNSNDLTDNNTVTSGTGVQGNAADFEDTNSEYLSISDATQTGLDITGDMTVSYWFNLETLPPSGDQNVFVAKWAGAGQQSIVLDLYNSAGTYLLRFVKRDSGGTAANASHTISPSTGTWYHAVGTFDATAQDLTIRFNDTSQTQDTSAQSSIKDSNAPFHLGQYSGAFYHDGLIDIVEVYDRVLTGAEITSLYNSGSGVACAGRGAAPAAVTPRTSVIPVY